MTPDEARRFADEWAAAWNARDLDRVLAHYTDDFEMSSPYIVRLVGEPTGTLRGKGPVGAYWRGALARLPDLHFRVLDVCTGVGSLVIHYQAAPGLRAGEVLFFNDQGLVYKAAAHYDRL